MLLTPEQIEKNFNKFRSLCEKLGDRSEAALKLVDTLGEKLALCPASAKRDYHCAYPGGLVGHSLRVLANALKLVSTFEWDIPRESLILAALLHDIGKVGMLDDAGEPVDFYVPQTEQWKIDKKGEEYSYNNEIPYMPTPQRSVRICHQFGLRLTNDEYLAILLNDGFVVDENKKYCLKVNPLVIAIQTSDYITTMGEKEDSRGF